MSSTDSTCDADLVMNRFCATSRLSFYLRRYVVNFVENILLVSNDTNSLRRLHTRMSNTAILSYVALQLIAFTWPLCGLNGPVANGLKK